MGRDKKTRGMMCLQVRIEMDLLKGELNVRRVTTKEGFSFARVCAYSILLKARPSHGRGRGTCSRMPVT